MTIQRVVPSGAWQVSNIVGGYLVTRTYYGYTAQEALQAFREWAVKV
jgi:hypothetical protein